MFFIGIFGVNQTEKPIGTYNNTICPNCGALTRLELYKRYTYFHLFFIPTFKWNLNIMPKAAAETVFLNLTPPLGRNMKRALIRTSGRNIYTRSFSSSLSKPVPTATAKSNRNLIIVPTADRNAKAQRYPA